MDKLQNKVLNFVSKQCGVKVSRLSLNTELRKDLGIAGMEAVDFFTAFDDEFDVELSKFEIDRYFEGEANGLLFPLWLMQWIYYKLFKKDQEDDLVPITIKDLVDSVRTEKWVL